MVGCGDTLHCTGAGDFPTWPLCLPPCGRDQGRAALGSAGSLELGGREPPPSSPSWHLPLGQERTSGSCSRGGYEGTLWRSRATEDSPWP